MQWPLFSFALKSDLNQPLVVPEITSCARLLLDGGCVSIAQVSLVYTPAVVVVEDLFFLFKFFPHLTRHKSFTCIIYVAAEVGTWYDRCGCRQSSCTTVHPQSWWQHGSSSPGRHRDPLLLAGPTHLRPCRLRGHRSVVRQTGTA